MAKFTRLAKTIDAILAIGDDAVQHESIDDDFPVPYLWQSQTRDEPPNYGEEESEDNGKD